MSETINYKPEYVIIQAATTIAVLIIAILLMFDTIHDSFGRIISGIVLIVCAILMYSTDDLLKDHRPNYSSLSGLP